MDDRILRTISVIIPALNEEKNLSGAVRTVLDGLGRDFIDFELLIFNDGSTDRTGMVAEELAGKDSRVKVIHNPRTFGLGFNYARGAELAKMEYVTWFPGDNDAPGDGFRTILRAVGSADIVVPYLSNAHVRPWARRVVSATYVRILNMLFGLRLRYYNGPAVYRRLHLSRVPIQTSGFACLASTLIRLLRLGLSYVEVPFQTDPTGTRRHGVSKAFRLKNIVSVGKAVAGLLWEVRVKERRRYGGVPRRVELQV